MVRTLEILKKEKSIKKESIKERKHERKSLIKPKDKVDNDEIKKIFKRKKRKGRIV